MHRDVDVVVIGGSLAGLLAAAACVGGRRSVMVVERDASAADPLPRPGVPQGSHQHVLLHRGLLAAEQLLPGLRGDLLAAGAGSIDTGQLLWLAKSGWLVPGRTEFEILAATRPLVESVVHARVTALPGVTLRPGRGVDGLLGTSRRVTGVAVAGDEHRAGLVIDASGRSTRLPTWLSALGVPTPSEEVVDARIGYTSRLYGGHRGEFGGTGLFVLPTPETPTGASALPVEGSRWLVTAVGVGDQRPPRDEPGLARFLADLREPAFSEFVTRATPASPITVHRQTRNQRRRYDRLATWPHRLLVLGDALTAFNPVYGHGIAVAAQQALALRDAMPAALDGGREGPLLRAFTRIAALPWDIATSEDLRYATSSGQQTVPQRMFSAYTDALGRLATSGDTHARYVLASVYHLMAPPTRLFAPTLLASLVRRRLTGRGEPVPRPAALERAGGS